jgi:serine/threonine-protein kinase RsbW
VASTSWTVVASEQNVAQVRESVAEFAYENGVREPRLSDVRLAVSEAVTNVVVHAFRGFTESGTVTVAVAVREHEWIEVRVTDHGSGMAPRDDSPGLGLGLPLIRHLADQFSHQHPPDGVGTEVCMRFALPRAGGPEGGPPEFTCTRDTAS